MVKVRGIEFQGNLDNPMGLEFYNLSHRFGFQHPNWPYFQDVKIERIHYMAKSGVLSQRITTTMHATTRLSSSIAHANRRNSELFSVQSLSSPLVRPPFRPVPAALAMPVSCWLGGR